MIKIGYNYDMYILNPYIYGAGGTSYLLDTYTAAAAYSLRQLKTGVTNVVRVRRSSDNAESDFTADELTDGTLTTWTGANDGFVVTWYEQSGNSSDLTEATAANQPQLVSSGSVLLDGSHPALYFDGTNDQFTASGNSNWDLANNLTLVSVSSMPDVAGVAVVYSQRQSTNKGWWLANDSSTAVNLLAFNDGSTDGLNLNSQQNTTDQRLLFCTSATGTLNGYYNGTQQETGVTSATTWQTGATFSVGRLGSQSLWYKSYQQEIIIFESDESSNRSDIETNINDFYSIY